MTSKRPMSLLFIKKTWIFAKFSIRPWTHSLVRVMVYSLTHEGTRAHEGTRGQACTHSHCTYLTMAHCTAVCTRSSTFHGQINGWLEQYIFSMIRLLPGSFYLSFNLDLLASMSFIDFSSCFCCICALLNSTCKHRRIL